MNRHNVIITLFVVFIALEIASAQQPLYPLHIGDRWEYTVQPGTARIERDSVMPNTHRYALIRFGWGRPERWERAEGSRVFWYDPQTEQEYLWYDFSRSPGDTVSIIPRAVDSTIIYLAGSGTYNLFGALRRWWSFLIDYRTRAIDDEEGITITDSLGLTHISSVWYSSELRGAIIDGRQYGTITYVADASDKPPLEPRLEQNFPNPFNPTTTIVFSVPRPSAVSLKVFDVLGREVETLVSGDVHAGTFSVTWDAQRASSGVYFYRLQADGYSTTKRMLLMR